MPEFNVAHARHSRHGQGEDRLAIHVLPCGGLVVVVADGAGGLVGGAAAAELVLSLVAQALARPDFESSRAEAWCQLLREADLFLLRDPLAGESTAVVVAWSPAGLVGASAGDSEAWMIRRDLDDLTLAQPRRRLGSGQVTPVGFSRATPVGSLLVASDGLFKYASVSDLCALVSEGEPHEAVERLVSRVRLPSGALQDDVAVVLVRLGSGPSACASESR